MVRVRVEGEGGWVRVEGEGGWVRVDGQRATGEGEGGPYVDVETAARGGGALERDLQAEALVRRRVKEEVLAGSGALARPAGRGASHGTQPEDGAAQRRVVRPEGGGAHERRL